MANLISRIFGRKDILAEVDVDEANRFLLQNGFDIYSADFPEFDKLNAPSPSDRYNATFSDLRVELIKLFNPARVGTKVSGIYHIQLNSTPENPMISGKQSHYAFTAIEGKLTELDERSHK